MAMTDEEIREKACKTKSCVRYAAVGYAYCNYCLHGRDRKLSLKDAIRKLELDQVYVPCP